MLGRDIKQKLAAGTPVIGSWVSLPEPALVEIMARSGFEFLTIDMEHSAITVATAQELIRVIDLCGCCPLVRLTSNDADLAKRVLDAGAAGIIVPMVNSADEARAAVRAAKYPPAGTRSVGLGRAQGYGTSFDAYFAAANDDTLVIVQIEHEDAVASIDDILSVPGVDAFMIGPYDLSASMGLAGQLEHPKVMAAVARVVEVGRARNVPSGFHFVWPVPAEFERRVREGFTLAAYSVDFLLLGETCRRDLVDIRRRLAGTGGSPA